MYHYLEWVAKEKFLDEKSFIDFAIKNKEKYGLDGRNMVSTFHVDQLVEDWIKAFPSLASKARDEHIQRIREENRKRYSSELLPKLSRGLSYLR